MPIHKTPYPSPRVSQLDADILDNELFSLLKQQLSDAFQHLTNKSWTYNQHPELWSLVLKLVIFKLTTYKSGSSYGFKLQNLKLTNASSGKIIGSKLRYALLATIFGEYIFNRISSYLYTLGDDTVGGVQRTASGLKAALIKHKSKILKTIGDSLKVLELANFTLFLVNGKYPNLIYRVLGITVTPIVADLLKFNGNNVNFEFQNRQLVWNVVTEFFVFILPLLHLRKWTRLFRSMITKRGIKNNYGGWSKTPITTKYSSLPESQCAMCVEFVESSGLTTASAQVTNPCITNCGHIFSYTCLATRFNAIENGNENAEACPRCGMKLTSFREYGTSEDEVDKDAIMVTYEEPSDDELEAEREESSPANTSPSADSSSENEDVSDNEDEEEQYSEGEDLEQEMESYGDDDSGYDDFDSGDDFEFE